MSLYRARPFAAVIALAMAAAGCVSQGDLQGIESRLTDVQQQLLQLRKDGSSKAEVAELGTQIGEGNRALASGQAEIATRLGELARQLEQLEAKLEDTNFRLAQLAQQIAATNQELQALRDAAALQQSPSPPAPSAAKGDPQALYETAYNDYQRGNYDLAILGFLQYLEGSPAEDLADNATYWVGECYYRQGRYQKAIAQYDEVLSRYEGSDRIPSALLRKGFAYLELDQQAQAVVQLQHVICDYASTDEARLARQRLQALGIEVQC
ncbi:MAG: tol-pal system protein YbgF [Thermoanaerobaculia bacterium]|nr:tol-pal system protein YbgF [Thermoanaerobaculia bacterium]